MTNESILISEVIPATPQRIFSAWMDSAEHSAFTGDEAVVVPEVGGEHQSAGGYIKGRTLELNEGSRIVQSWRTTEFPAESPDSRVEITLEPTLGGTLVTLLHTDIPVGQGDRYRQGWNEYYLSRLKTYFADSEPTLETRAELEVDDVDVESEIVEIDPSTVSEAPTRVMSQGARYKKPAVAVAKSPAKTPAKTPAKKPAMAAKAKAPIKAAAKSAASSSAKKPALKAKAPATKVAAAKAASKKPTRLAIAVKSTKKVAAKARRGKAVSMKAAARKPVKAAAKTAKSAKKPAKKSAKKTSGKKGASSARSRRR